ncbi:hypothetical protein JNB88_31450 [Rhizobium cauense]|nr:hypothetical protein [Rhizobium cauense]MBW9118132.1 hypothetical protein [Rhizobium cauense]
MMRDKLYREPLSHDRLQESQELCEGLEREISFFLEHTARSDWSEVAKSE